MEIKHTIEILTKDIQDIEKLVGNLQNSEDGYTIELDLALAKLRNVYDILTMIKADRLHEMISQPPVVEASEKAEKEQLHVSGPEQTTEHDHATDHEKTTEYEQTAEPEQRAETDRATEPVQRTETDRAIEPLQSIDPDQTIGSRSTVTPGEKKEAEILAEKFSAESSINENLAGQRGQHMDHKLIGQPIDSISRNIGINDRFLIIRELFNGDSERFSKLINSLEGAGNYQDAISLLEKELSGSGEHEGVEILAGLVKRRYTRA